MKKFLVLLALIIDVQCYSQSVAPTVPPVIEVTGSAEMYVKPDIYFISLRILGNSFYGTDAPEKKVEDALTKAVVKSTDFSLAIINYEARTSNIQPNDRPPYRDYILRIQTEKQLLDIFTALHAAGVEHSFVSGVDYTKKAAIIKELGIHALNNASEKASSTLSAINRSNSRIISIVEEFSGTPEVNDRLMPVRYNKFQQQNDGYMDDRGVAAQSNYERIQFKVIYRVQYSIL